MAKTSHIVDAIAWILANRETADGKRFSRRSLSIAAGLSPSHVEQILAKRQSSDISLPTARGLARAGNVRLQWLLTGTGPREPFVEEEGASSLSIEDDRYPSRAHVITLARGRGVEPHILQALAQEALQSEHDPGVGYWTQRLAQVIRDDRDVQRAIDGTLIAPTETKPSLPGRPKTM